MLSAGFIAGALFLSIRNEKDPDTRKEMKWLGRGILALLFIFSIALFVDYLSK